MTSFWSDFVIPKERSRFLTLGHRSSGKNRIWSSEDAPDHRPSIKDNTIISSSQR
eukprot:c54956_g1_i1 orf=139-303(+)